MKLQPNPRRRMDGFGRPIGNWIYGVQPVSETEAVTARGLMAAGATLKEAALIVGIHSADLDLAMWRRIGGHLKAPQ